MLTTILTRFMATETRSGILLLAASLLALVIANSPWQEYYSAFFSHGVLFGINDALMVLFFLLIGMEVKRELLKGELSEPSQALLPLAAALGGMLCPAAIYVFFNQGDAEALHGWAIASATDIAFSLCILNLCGRRVPASLKVFLTAIAVIDDIGAILIIALFYTHALAPLWLLAAAAIMLALWRANRRQVNSLPLYAALGVALWAVVVMSGVHATIAGVLLGVMIPLQKKDGDYCMLTSLETRLHPWVSYGVLPLFAFANAGVSFMQMPAHHFFMPVALGVTAGLFAGKQAGIFLFTALPVGLGLAKKPEGCSWPQLYGVAAVAGIGFTMSLFIGGLAFGEGAYFSEAKLGILAGSLLSALAGYALLRFTASGPGQS